jgi:Rieske Fe-S protein
MTLHNPTRRHVLAAGTAAAGALAATACGSGTANIAPPPAAQPTPNAPNTPLAKLTDIPIGQAVKAKTPDGQDVIVARPTDNTAAAFSATCTHMGCKVNPQGTELHCPCHGSVFDATSGEVRHGPANKPLPPVKVTVANGQVFPE